MPYTAASTSRADIAGSTAGPPKLTNTPAGLAPLGCGVRTGQPGLRLTGGEDLRIPGGEDYDQFGVVVEMPEEVLGLDEHGVRTVMQRTQPEGVRSGPGDIDRTLHSLRRFVRLATSGNPSILMALWAPIDHATPEGKDLQSLGEAFVGRHVVPRYRGYMQSQAQRPLGTRAAATSRTGCSSPAAGRRRPWCRWWPSATSGDVDPAG